jgi:cyanophycin synthetase
VEIIGRKVFSGRSIYSHKKCIRLNLDMEGLGNIKSNEIPGLNDYIIKLLPEVKNHRCNSGKENGFFNNLNKGIYLHHMCCHLAIALQNIIGIDVSFCKESGLTSQTHFIIYQYQYEKTALETGKIAVEIINSFIKKRVYDINTSVGKLKELLAREQNNGVVTDIYRNESRHIPLVAITGTNGKTTTTRLIAHTLSNAGYKVGMTTTDGIYIDRKCVFKGDTTGPRSALTVLNHKEITAAVLETARGGLIRDGLAYDLADVSVITNITDDHLGLDDVNSLEDLAKVKALVGEAVKPEGYVVINADDAMSRTIIHRIRSKIIFFSKNKTNILLTDNLKRGGYGIFIDQNRLCIMKGNLFIPLIKLEDISITMKGALQYNTENAMAACGALIGLGVELSTIRESLKSFQCSEELNPGRFNSFDINGITAVLDYGHNIDGYKSVLQGIKNIKHNKLIGVIGVPGDRLDSNILDVGKISGNYFDHIYVKEDKDKRGRFEGEVANLLEKGALSSNLYFKSIEKVLDEQAAFAKALDSAEPGDIVIVFFEEYEPLLKIVKDRINSVNLIHSVSI